MEIVGKDKFDKLVKSLSSKKKYQDIYEHVVKDGVSLRHGKTTKDFISWCQERVTKMIERKKANTSKEPETIEFIDDKSNVKAEEEKISIGGDLVYDTEDETESSAIRIKMPAVFKTTYNEFWAPIIQKEIDMYKKGKPRTKGFLFLIEGKGKTGKTHFAQSSVKFRGYTSKYRNIPPGRPVYVLEADAANRDEAETKWYKYLPSNKNPEGLIHIGNCFVESEATGFVDPEATLKNFYAGMFSLRDVKEGTLVVDPFTMVCEYVIFVYMLKHTDEDGEFDITFDEFLKPSRKITITEYQYRKKLIYELLRKLRMFNINVILIGNVKPIYSDNVSIYKKKPTGQYESDVQKGTEYWVDAIGRFYKQDTKKLITSDDGTKTTKDVTKRYLSVTDCRFEDAELLSDKYVFEAPEFSDVISHLMEVYPK